ncbi:hypothetical protein [Aeoliella sp.]|uniref:hypothetical protein n=1 Tax=Aeoliella sp. TaxID=2795800 RepID=UPI003CCBF9A2
MHSIDTPSPAASRLLLFGRVGLSPPSGFCVYYHTGAWRFALQINEASREDDYSHKATIIPDRYGLRPVGWHPFTLFEDNEQLAQEAARLKPHLGRRLFKDRRWLAEFKRQHPELVQRAPRS